MNDNLLKCPICGNDVIDQNKEIDFKNMLVGTFADQILKGIKLEAPTFFSEKMNEIVRLGIDGLKYKALKK